MSGTLWCQAAVFGKQKQDQVNLRQILGRTVQHVHQTLIWQCIIAGCTCLRVLPVGLDWHNLLLESASVPSLGSSLVRGHSHLVLHVPGDAILGSHILRSHTCNNKWTMTIKLCRQSPAALASIQSKQQLRVLEQQRHNTIAASISARAVGSWLLKLL